MRWRQEREREGGRKGERQNLIAEGNVAGGEEKNLLLPREREREGGRERERGGGETKNLTAKVTQQG